MYCKDVILHGQHVVHEEQSDAMGNRELFEFQKELCLIVVGHVELYPPFWEAMIEGGGGVHVTLFC